MWQAERGSLASLAVALASAVAVATCHRGTRIDVPSAAAGPTQSAARDHSPAPSAAAAPSAPSELTHARPDESRAPAALGRFYAALADLEAKRRNEHVRVVWFGDSHTAADYMTGAMRKRLEARFGAGGPGFVRVGTSPYRHDGVRVVRDGKWKLFPEPLARRTPDGDGIFGLGGVLSQPSGGDARVEIRVDPKRVKGSVRYELLHRQKPGASFRLSIGKKSETVRSSAPGQSAKFGILRLAREGAPGDALEIGSLVGEPRFAGVVAEGSEPGFVLDTIGIDGARVATLLAWNAEAFAAEVAARRPALIVLAFGTNEVFDARRADAITGELGEVLARVRRRAPNTDCLIVGPPDAAAPDLTSLPRVAEMDAAERRAASQYGCGYFSLYEAMGGSGSFARWMREKEQLARPDRIHLTVAGYERLGEALAATILDGHAAASEH